MGRKPKNQPAKLYMSPADMATISENVFGDMWRTGLGDYMGISYSQIHRYMTLDQDIPKSFALGLVMLKNLKANEIAFPDLEEFMIDRHMAEPVRHVQVKKDKPAKAKDDAPEAGFGFGDDEPAAPAPKPMDLLKREDAAGRHHPPKEAAKKPTKAKPASKAKAKPKQAPAPAKETKSERDARKKREKRATEKLAKAKPETQPSA